jgi:hypothetical protein
MTPADRLRAVWRRERPDRTPWSPMLGDSFLRSEKKYWNTLSSEEQQALNTSYLHPSLVSIPNPVNFLNPYVWGMIRDIGGDITADVITAEPVNSQVEVQATSLERGQTQYQFHTPWGDLEEIVAASGSAETVFRVRTAVSGRDEYDIMARVVEERRYRPRFERFEETQAELGNDGAVYITGPDQPLVSLFRVREPADLIFDLIDEPERMQALLELLHKRALDGYRMVADGPGRMVQTGMAFITTQIISPRMFADLVLPYLAVYADLLHASGKILICHMCGHIHHLLPYLRESGIDGIDSLTNPPIGDSTLEEYWEELGNNKVLQGGIDINVLLHGTTEEVRQHTSDVLARSQNRPLILRTADEVPYGTPLQNLLAVTDAVQNSSG